MFSGRSNSGSSNSTRLRVGTPSGDEFRGSQGGLVVDTWSTSPERDSYFERLPFIMIALGVALVIAVIGWALVRPSDRTAGQWFGEGSLVLVGLILFLCLMPFWASRRAYFQRKHATAEARVDRSVELIAKRDDLPLNMLFELNRRQLDEYQEMTKKQQRSAFRLTQVASVIAFLALIAGVVLSMQNSPGSEKYVVAGLSGLGALLSAFLANTFYQAHRDANRQLNRYYLEPQRTGRIIAAERLARFLHEPAYANRMIKSLLEWEMPIEPGEDHPNSRKSKRSTNGAKADSTN